MWVQLRSSQQIAQLGVSRMYHPGDWVDVGRQQATLWLSQGKAIIPGAGENGRIAIPGSGVVVPEGTLLGAKTALSPLNLEVAEGDGLRYERTLLWDGVAPLQIDLVPAGFGFLDRWQIAVPLADYERLAVHVGDEADRERTKAVIRDLRVPLYDTRIMFVRRDKDTQRLLQLWRGEPGHAGLAFLRALYTVKPLILALPTTWVDRNAPR